MNRIIPTALAAMLLTACAGPAPKGGEPAAPGDLSWQDAPDDAIVLPTVAQCIAHIERRAVDASALAGAGYVPYAPPLKPAGWRAVPRTMTVGPFGRDAEREVVLRFREERALGAERGCIVTSSDILPPGSFLAALAANGYAAAPETPGRYWLTKGDRTLSFSVVRKVNLGAGAMFNVSEYKLLDIS